jgi:hypothetical protein
MTVEETAREVRQVRCVIPQWDRDFLGDLVQPCDHGADFVSGTNNYSWWAAIGLVEKPLSIVEIGTRYGYSLKCLLGARVGPLCRVLSVDSEYDGEPTRRVFVDCFRNVLGVTNLMAMAVDSQTLEELPERGYDLGVVDAMHSADGCYHDCGLVWGALRSGGLMVVDDTIDGGCVREGCERFCRDRGVEWAYLPSLRGIHLVRKP